MRRLVLALAALALLLPAVLPAQSIASRIGATRTGTVWMSFASAKGVCGNGRGQIAVKKDDQSAYFENVGEYQKEWKDECVPGPVRVSLDLERGTVASLRAYVGGNWNGRAALDLGTVPTAEAIDFLLGIAERGAAKPAKEAIFPASIAEGAVVWPRLLTLARDDARPREVRASAIFWVSQAASAAATEGLQEIVDDPSGDRELRKSAIFSLSRRPHEESVPALLRVARTHKDPELRRTAIFWLGQSKDPRAIAYFEEILLRARFKT